MMEAEPNVDSSVQDLLPNHNKMNIYSVDDHSVQKI